VTAIGGGRFRATFTAPAGAYVTLRTTAHDAADGSITETITRGYATGPRPSSRAVIMGRWRCHRRYRHDRRDSS
jgi:hypothetical protein